MNLKLTAFLKIFAEQDREEESGSYEKRLKCL